jgi:hypothetical protein
MSHLGHAKRRARPDGTGSPGVARLARSSVPGEPSEPLPLDQVDEWGYESFPASDPPQH